MSSSEPQQPPGPCPRPADLARILLAASGATPRARARDQQADLAGEALCKEVLDRLAVLDPEPGDLDSALLGIVTALGEPTGPTRAMSLTIRHQWQMIQSSPGYWTFLLHQALHGEAGQPPRRAGLP